MEAIKQLSVVLRRQTDAIKTAVTYPSISKNPQQKTITTIPNSPHPTLHIIENDDRYVTPVHRVIAHQSNLWTHIIQPDTPHPRRTETHLRIESTRMLTVTQLTPILLPRASTAQHPYNLRPKRQLAYSCTQTGTLSLAANVITAMEANAVIHPITGVPQEYRHLITRDKKVTRKRSFDN